MCEGRRRYRVREVVLLRLALLALALCVPLLGGCLDTSSGDDAEGPKIIAGDWPMERPSSSRFEPGKRNGQPVKFRMRVPITFPKQS